LTLVASNRGWAYIKPARTLDRQLKVSQDIGHGPKGFGVDLIPHSPGRRLVISDFEIATGSGLE
jgi:hypothetical protein